MYTHDDDTSGLPIVSPAHLLPVQVLRREIIAPETVTLFLVLPGTGQAPAPYLPGQFVTLAFPTQRQTLYRSYSLCGDGRPDQPWEITVKRLQQGAVSTYLHDQVEEGMLLYASMPRGTFTLPANLQPDTPLVFVAVGSGITPIMGMLSALARLSPEHRPQVQLHYAARSPVEMIYRAELQRLDPREHWLRKWYYLASDGNRLTPETVLARARLITLQAHWYTCGPESLKRDVMAELEAENVPDEQVHAEVFTPQSGQSRASGSLSQATGRTSRLQIDETGATLDVRAHETLLDALERQGYRPDWSCRAGACGTCKLRVLAGQAQPAGEALSAAERRAGYVLSCVAMPLGDVTLASGGRAPAGGMIPAAAPGTALVARRLAATRIRFASLLAVGGLFFGSWMLTNHKPASLYSQSSAAPTQGVTTTPGGTTPGVTPTVPATSQSTPTSQPATNGTNPTPAPTAKQATPTPRPPAPTPTTQTGTSKPSH